MAKKEQGRACWFRMFRNIRNVVDAVPDASAGAALKAVFAYFDTGVLPENLDPLGYALFLTIKPAVDAPNEDYQKAVECGRKGSRKRWAEENSPPIAPLTEIETEIEKDIKEDIKKEIETEKETEKEIEKEIKKEADPPLRPLPRALEREMDFNERRELALDKLRRYPA